MNNMLEIFYRFAWVFVLFTLAMCAWTAVIFVRKYSLRSELTKKKAMLEAKLEKLEDAYAKKTAQIMDKVKEGRKFIK